MLICDPDYTIFINIQCLKVRKSHKNHILFVWAKFGDPKKGRDP